MAPTLVPGEGTAMTILSTLIGFLTSGLPSLLKFFQDRNDKAHELALMDKQIAAQAALQAQRLEEVKVSAMIQEQIALLKPGADAPVYAPPPVQSGVRWVDALDGFMTVWVNILTASVRPVVTYANNAAFWALVAADAIVTLGLAQHFNLGGAAVDKEALQELLDSKLIDAVLVTYSSINGFWFGTRTWQKLAGK